MQCAGRRSNALRPASRTEEGERDGGRAGGGGVNHRRPSYAAHATPRCARSIRQLRTHALCVPFAPIGIPVHLDIVSM